QSVASFRTAAEVESELCCRGTMALPALDANFSDARIHRGDKSFAAVQDWRGSPALRSVRDRHLHSGDSLTATTATCSAALRQYHPMVRGGRGHPADRYAVSSALDNAIRSPHLGAPDQPIDRWGRTPAHHRRLIDPTAETAWRRGGNHTDVA